MSKLRGYVEKFGGVVEEERLYEVFDREWLSKALEVLEEKGVVFRVGKKIVFKGV